MVETGPARHGIGGATFVYILEPGGNRIELMGDPGYMIFDPAWRTVVWKRSELQMRPSDWFAAAGLFLFFRDPSRRGASSCSGGGTRVPA